MIKLSKGLAPTVLVDNQLGWTRRLVEKAAAGETPTKAELGRYNHPSIKAALLRETHGKCAYCEAKIGHVTYGDIEHICPKGIDPALRFEWDNLTIACDVCNTKKGVASGLVDPYRDDPDDYFDYHGPLVFALDDEAKGYKTFAVFQLNRAELRERRAERLGQLERLLRTLRSVEDLELKQAIREEIMEVELSDESEFAASARSFAKRRAPDLFA